MDISIFIKKRFLAISEKEKKEVFENLSKNDRKYFFQRKDLSKNFFGKFLF